jgi:hypothetical protein
VHALVRLVDGREAAKERAARVVGDDDDGDQRLRRRDERERSRGLCEGGRGERGCDRRRRHNLDIGSRSPFL